jgi:hypothetical protein
VQGSAGSSLVWLAPKHYRERRKNGRGMSVLTLSHIYGKPARPKGLAGPWQAVSWLVLIPSGERVRIGDDLSGNATRAS